MSIPFVTLSIISFAALATIICLSWTCFKCLQLHHWSKRPDSFSSISSRSQQGLRQGQRSLEQQDEVIISVQRQSVSYMTASDIASPDYDNVVIEDSPPPSYLEAIRI